MPTCDHCEKDGQLFECQECLLVICRGCPCACDDKDDEDDDEAEAEAEEDAA